VRRLLFVSSAVVIVAVVEIVLPGKTVYHAGWLNLAIAALIAIASSSRPRRRAAWAVLSGCIVAGIAAVAFGLFAPDDRDITGAPGQRVAVEGLGTLVFPIVDAGYSMPDVALVRSRRRTVLLGARGLNVGDAIVRETPRSVVGVEAFDPRGNHLTITQPQGAVFLSPVLTMQHTQAISGLNLPFDSFNVPAAGRVVKAILFSPAEAAVMLHGVAPGHGAVLFAVDDENDRPLPHAIVLGPDGETVRAGGLTLRATIQQYPAVTVVPVPNLFAVCAGVLLAAGGVAALALLR
jgi:hypothetical protein